MRATSKCGKCQKEKSEKDFYFNKKRNKLESICIQCRKDYYKNNRDRIRKNHKIRYRANRETVLKKSSEYQKKNWNKVMSRRRLNTYGINEIQYSEMLTSQNNVCAICKKKETKRDLHVDHDHVTGKVRGLLCGKCNAALGMVNDDKEILMRMYKYLDLFSMAGL